MIHEAQLKKLRSLGFEVANRGEDNQGEYLKLEYRGTEDQFRMQLPDEWHVQHVVGTTDEPTFGRVRPSPIYSGE